MQASPQGSRLMNICKHHPPSFLNCPEEVCPKSGGHLLGASEEPQRASPLQAVGGMESVCEPSCDSSELLSACLAELGRSVLFWHAASSSYSHSKRARRAITWTGIDNSAFMLKRYIRAVVNHTQSVPSGEWTLPYWQLSEVEQDTMFTMLLCHLLLQHGLTSACESLMTPIWWLLCRLPTHLVPVPSATGTTLRPCR